MAPKTEARWPSSSVPSYKTLDFGLLDMVRGGNPTCPLPQTALRPLPTRPSEKMDNKHLDNGFQKGIGKAVDSGTSDSAAAVDEARWIERNNDAAATTAAAAAYTPTSTTATTSSSSPTVSRGIEAIRRRTREQLLQSGITDPSSGIDEVRTRTKTRLSEWGITDQNDGIETLKERLRYRLAMR